MLVTQMSNVARNEIASPCAGNYLSQMSSDVKYFYFSSFCLGQSVFSSDQSPIVALSCDSLHWVNGSTLLFAMLYFLNIPVVHYLFGQPTNLTLTTTWILLEAGWLQSTLIVFSRSPFAPGLGISLQFLCFSLRFRCLCVCLWVTQSNVVIKI